ncbi:MAG: ATP synthase F1 subunit gamma [Candidatus Omnitrophota bacterium]
MIQSFRQLKNRIKGIESTRKITHAMEMVSAAKLNRARSDFVSSKAYFANLGRILSEFLSDTAPVSHPLLETKTGTKQISLMVIASDAGLCSNYNHNIIRLAREFAEKAGKANVRIIAVGKEVYSYFKKEGYAVENSYLGIRGKFSNEIAADIAKTLKDSFLENGAGEVYAAYTHFKPNLRHLPAVERILPIAYPKKENRFYILEPDKTLLLGELIAKYFLYHIRGILLDALTAEHSARMLAMKLATDNADELIEVLTLQKNKARQFAITKEVLEIAMSAEALKG